MRSGARARWGRVGERRPERARGARASGRRAGREERRGWSRRRCGVLRAEGSPTPTCQPAGGAPRGWRSRVRDERPLCRGAGAGGGERGYCPELRAHARREGIPEDDVGALRLGGERLAEVAEDSRQRRRGPSKRPASSRLRAAAAAAGASPEGARASSSGRGQREGAGLAVEAHHLERSPRRGAVGRGGAASALIPRRAPRRR